MSAETPGKEIWQGVIVGSVEPGSIEVSLRWEAHDLSEQNLKRG
jgi:hypothetical protein